MNWQSFSTGAVLVLGIALLVGVGFAFTQLDTAEQTAVHPTDEPGFVVDVHADGNASIAVTYTYNLTEPEQQEAFSDLQDSESARAHYRDEFESRLSRVAANASERVDRTMSVSNGEIRLETVDDTGVVTVSVTWQNLAGHDGEDLVVTEPFASGFYPDRPFSAVLPAEYTVSSATPTPADSTDGSLQWAAGTDLTGFELVLAAPSDDGSTGGAEDGSSDGTDGGSTDGTNDGATDGTEDTDDGTTDDGATTDESGDSQDGDADGGDESGEKPTDGTNDTDDGADGGADDSGPGFGVLLALVALAAAVMARQ